MKRLALDTSADFCAACVYDTENARVLSSVSRNIGRGHAELLMDVIGECLENAHSAYADLSTLTVTVGPGSFTGVRVGLSAARAISLALDVPLCGIDNLTACAKFAQASHGIENPVTLLDARRGEAYCLQAGQEPCISDYRVLGERLSGDSLVLCGSGAPVFNQELGRENRIVHSQPVPPIEFLASLDLMAGDHPPEPLYLRPADAKPQTGFVLPRAKV